MINISELSRYRAPFYFKKYDSFEDYINEQLNIHVQHEELDFIRKHQNSPLIDHVLMRMNKCTSDSLDFYARLLFHNTKYDEYIEQCVKIFSSRFNAEENKDTKLRIFNNIRLLITRLEDIQNVLNDEILSILVGEYARKKNISFEEIANDFLPQKFLGFNFFANKLIGDLEDVERYVEINIEILKILAFYEECQSHPKLKDILKKDKYLQFYCLECKVNLEILKNLTGDYNSYSLFLILKLIKDDQEICREKMVGLEQSRLNDIFILSMLDSSFMSTYRDLLKGNLEIVLSGDYNRFSEARGEILVDEYFSLNDPIDLEIEEEEFVKQFERKESKNFHFGAIESLAKLRKIDYIIEKSESENVVSYKAIDKLETFRKLDNFLYEKYLEIELRGYLQKINQVSIRHWLNLDEAYFSFAVEKCPILKDFHRSFLMTKKKRSKIAEELLKGSHRDLFLEYLDKRGIYVELKGVEVIEYDFSTEWLKMFIEENYNTFDVKEGECVRIDLGNKVLEIKDKMNIIDKKTKEVPTVKKIKMNGTVKEIKKANEDFEIFRELLEGEKEIKDFKRFGLLNQFISENIGKIEECARVSSCVILNQKQFSKFLNTLTFVIEDKKILNDFLFHFLRLCQFNFELSSIEHLVEEPNLIITFGKVDLKDLDTLVEKYKESFSEEIALGILFRSYSYVLALKGGSGNAFRKVKDGNVSFYYKIGKNIQLKYKDLVISYSDRNLEEYLKILTKDNSTFRKLILQRSRNILKGYLKEEEEAVSDTSVEEEEEKLYSEFPKDPENNLDLILKGVREGSDIPRSFIFDLFKILNGDNEKVIFEILRGLSLDPEICLYSLSRFESYTQDVKINIISLITKVDQKIFIKLCEIIANEDNLQVLRVLLTSLKDKKNLSPLIESWKNNYKLKKLMVRIYPLSYQDKEFYSTIFEEYKYDDEKEMLRDIFSLGL